VLLEGATFVSFLAAGPVRGRGRGRARGGSVAVTGKVVLHYGCSRTRFIMCVLPCSWRSSWQGTWQGTRG
jgi:hypothetical protein